MIERVGYCWTDDANVSRRRADLLGQSVYLLWVSVEQARALFETNVFGLMRVTRAVLPVMRAQGSGRIINLSSIVGLIPVPFMALCPSLTRTAPHPVL
jgi:NAD(P)-dependent dehydrogenase (short-subunit alcohol dehydrogenase family)